MAEIDIEDLTDDDGRFIREEVLHLMGELNVRLSQKALHGRVRNVEHSKERRKMIKDAINAWKRLLESQDDGDLQEMWDILEDIEERDDRGESGESDFKLGDPPW